MLMRAVIPVAVLLCLSAGVQAQPDMKVDVTHGVGQTTATGTATVTATITAIDAATGEFKKSARVPGAIDSYYASPIAADGKLFLFSEKGLAAVLQPGADWQLLQVNDFDEPIYATPAVAQGRLYIRTASALFAIGAPKMP